MQAYRALNICEEWGAETGHDQPAMAKLGGANVCLVPSLGSVSTCGGTQRHAGCAHAAVDVSSDGRPGTLDPVHGRMRRL